MKYSIKSRLTSLFNRMASPFGGRWPKAGGGLLLFFVAATAMAQVDMSGLSSEQLQDGQSYYIVSTHGYFVTTKGSMVQSSTVAPDAAEWKAMDRDSRLY